MDEISQELKGIERDKKEYLMAVAAQQRKFAEMLMAEMGDDMEKVLSGQVKVELTKKEKKKMCFTKIIEKIKDFFRKWQ